MAPSAPPGQEPLPGKQFTYQLAAVVRSINWTYAVFWSASTNVCPAGVLTWKDGFYNGQIKTTNERVLHTQRSVQLRELYCSLSSGNSNQQVSPEDLTDDEWYYMLSMTYTFQPGQGLPGKCLASNQHVWLCNAQHADTKTFERALLAKTTSLKTVVCIPFMGGVLELGVSNLVLDDPDMVNWINTSFWHLHLEAFLVEESSSGASATNETKETNAMLEDIDHYAIDGVTSEMGEVEHVIKEMDGFYSFDETLDMGAHKDNLIMNGSFEVPSSLDTTQAVDELSDDVFVTISSSIQNSHQSNFTSWMRPFDLEEEVLQVNGESQNLLKKVVSGDKWMNNRGGDTTTRSRQSNIKAHVMSERRQGKKTKEMFLVLKSLLPSIHNVDKASILAETIAYLKELKERVEELESSRVPPCPKETNELWDHDVASGKKIKVSDESKGKASEVRQHDVSNNIVNVVVMEKEVLFEVQCRWKELMVTQVFDEIKSLCLDVVSVHTSTCGDLLDLKIRSNQQFACDSTIMAPGMITEAMKKAICKR